MWKSSMNILAILSDVVQLNTSITTMKMPHRFLNKNDNGEIARHDYDELKLQIINNLTRN